MQIFDFQSQFSLSKIIRIFPKKNFIEEYNFLGQNRLIQYFTISYQQVHDENRHNNQKAQKEYHAKYVVWQLILRWTIIRMKKITIIKLTNHHYRRFKHGVTRIFEIGLKI